MTPLLGDVGGGLLHLATFNVRRPLPHFLSLPADSWDRRRQAMMRMLASEAPAVLATQEVLPSPARDILQSLGTSYTRIGVGRGRGGRGEGCPIFFDTARLELVATRQLALSDTPELPGSRSWGNLVPRIMVVGVFRHRTTGARFAVINTHLDPFSARSRLRGADAVRDEVRRLGFPAVVTGDLNAGVDSATQRALLKDDLLTDAWATADERVTPEFGTYTGYRDPIRGGARIDVILTSPDIAVDRIGIDARREDGIAPSDHLAIHAAIEVPR